MRVWLASTALLGLILLYLLAISTGNTSRLRSITGKSFR